MKTDFIIETIYDGDVDSIEFHGISPGEPLLLSTRSNTGSRVFVWVGKDQALRLAQQLIKRARKLED